MFSNIDFLILLILQNIIFIILVLSKGERLEKISAVPAETSLAVEKASQVQEQSSPATEEALPVKEEPTPLAEDLEGTIKAVHIADFETVCFRKITR